MREEGRTTGRGGEEKGEQYEKWHGKREKERERNRRERAKGRKEEESRITGTCLLH